mgnify:CR=1 FL=1
MDGTLSDLDRRLTRLEEMIAGGFREITRRLDTLNGQVARHEQWQHDHDARHTTIAVEQAELRAAYSEQRRQELADRAADRWRWGVRIAVATAATNALLQVALRLLAR